MLAHDNKDVEKILLGKGIAFSKKEGDEVDKSKIDRKFRLESNDLTSKFIELVNEIPVSQIELTDKIVRQAEQELKIKFDDSIYIGLADHLNYALKRLKDGEELPNAFLWEIKKYYPKEFQTALNTLETIYYYTKVKPSENEASFIALHFVNAQKINSDNIEKSSINDLTIIRDFISIIQYHYSINLDDTSLNYSRFITHLKFFLHRLQESQRYETEDLQLFKQVAQKYPEAFTCVNKLNVYLKNKMNVTMTTEEQLYFMLHVNRLTERVRKNE